MHELSLLMPHLLLLEESEEICFPQPSIMIRGWKVCSATSQRGGKITKSTTATPGFSDGTVFIDGPP